MKYKLKLSGLDCAHCTQKIEDRINQENDIKDCLISFANGIMTLYIVFCNYSAPLQKTSR